VSLFGGGPVSGTLDIVARFCPEKRHSQGMEAGIKELRDHLSRYSAIADSDVVLVTGDSDLATAANLVGIAVSITSA
jgi:hypothetical protein